ncbi:RICIN domain-containing protein [Streptomyces sp. B3I8]|uniref:RICIN domain-containing protein n=1 Tax=Streptomyces sp. B3I8 TaxID=3042303 RepID=UPI00278AB4EC|nr:RICIN domain-containing protein [Streptomyces sp. B3I8]MDQ0784811.1 hypothetical protein [Streptomyces sp. B3I8]
MSDQQRSSGEASGRGGAAARSPGTRSAAVRPGGDDEARAVSPERAPEEGARPGGAVPPSGARDGDAVGPDGRSGAGTVSGTRTGTASGTGGGAPARREVDRAGPTGAPASASREAAGAPAGAAATPTGPATSVSTTATSASTTATAARTTAGAPGRTATATAPGKTVATTAGAAGAGGAVGAAGAVGGRGAGAVAAAGSGDGPSGPDESGHGPRKPVLAGAALAGALLIALPLLMMATNDDKDHRQKVTAAGVSDTVVDGGDSPAGAFVAESPSATATKKKRETPGKEAAREGRPESSPAAPPASATTGTAARKQARRKAPSTLPAVLTKVLIRNHTNGTCVDIPGYSSGAADGPVIQADCDGSPDDNQLWNVEKRYAGAGPGGAPLFQIRNVMDSMCLDLPDFGGVDAGTKVTEFSCDGTKGDNQLWWLDRQAAGKYWVRNAAAGNMCLDADGRDDSTRDLLVSPCAPENLNNHEWTISRP